MHDFSRYRQILAAPTWQAEPTPLPDTVAEWLLHTDSLTQKLQCQCAHLQVKVIQQGWQAVDFSGNSAICWVREVLLQCGESDWIFAQTLLPKQTVDAVAQEVLTLGTQPIGLWLFPQNPQRIELEWHQEQHTQLYARRSELRLKHHPLEIRELFLAQFPFASTGRKA